MVDLNDPASAKRRYSSSKREEAVAARRAAVVGSAITMLGDAERVGDVTLDAVARIAGVSRPTMYSQFGSRDGLLEAVFDALALAGGIVRLGDAAREADPQIGLEQLVATFVYFWLSNPAIGRIYAAMAGDPGIARALAPRLQIGRDAIRRLVDRLTPDLADHRRTEAAELIEILTDYPAVSRLSLSRDPSGVRTVILAACHALLSGRS